MKFLVVNDYSVCTSHTPTVTKGLLKRLGTEGLAAHFLKTPKESLQSHDAGKCMFFVADVERSPAPGVHTNLLEIYRRLLEEGVLDKTKSAGLEKVFRGKSALVIASEVLDKRTLVVVKAVCTSSLKATSFATGKRVRVVLEKAPKRAKRSYDYFATEFQRRRRVELAEKNLRPNFIEISQETRVAWNAMPDEAKVPFEIKAQQDKIRYQNEYKAYRVRNPEKPKRPRTAYNLYCIKHTLNSKKETAANWRNLGEEKKKKFTEASEQDKERYRRELEVYSAWCQRVGLDVGSVMSTKKGKPKKRRKTAVPHPEDESCCSEEAPAATLT